MSKALEAATYLSLVPDEEPDGLNAQMHVGRGGSLSLGGDPHGVLAETKAGLDHYVRECAYRLWQQAGQPDGRAEKFWHRAQYCRWCERAHAMWDCENRPEGKAEEHRHCTRRGDIST